MTIGRNSRKSSVRSSVRAPKFLDKSSGFYGRLDEPEATAEVVGGGAENDSSREMGVDISLALDVVHDSGADEEVDVFSGGMMEDDGETLLRRKPSRHSSRWRKSSRRRQREVQEEKTQEQKPSLVDAHMQEDKIQELKQMEEDNQKGDITKDPALAHFQIQEYAEDRVLIRDKKRGREEETEEERKSEKEQEEGMKVVKRNTVKSYRKAFDRALRRGWEAFIANLYSVTLTPVTPSPPSSSPSLKKQHQHTSVLAEFR